MSNSKKTRGKAKRERNITIRSVRRDEPDLRRISQVLIQLANAQAEAEAQAQHDESLAVAAPTVAESGIKSQLRTLSNGGINHQVEIDLVECDVK
jgi:hypothetical protein